MNNNHECSIDEFNVTNNICTFTLQSSANRLSADETSVRGDAIRVLPKTRTSHLYPSVLTPPEYGGFSIIFSNVTRVFWSTCGL
jgi:hypothetical protein